LNRRPKVYEFLAFFVYLGVVGADRSAGVSKIMRLDSDANDLSLILRGEIKKLLLETGDLRQLSGFGSKLAGAILRIALSLQILQDVDALEVDGTNNAICLPGGKSSRCRPGTVT